MEGKCLGYKKSGLALAAAAVILAGIFFYAGAKYEKRKLTSLGLLGCAQEEVDENALYLKGTLVAKNENGFTLKLADGTQKEILFSDETTFGAKKNGVVEDFLVGQLLVVNGKTNPDGSLTIENIKISKKSPKIDSPETK